MQNLPHAQKAAHSLIFFICSLVLFNQTAVAQRYATGGLVFPKSADVAWQVIDDEGDATELNPTDIWLPWKIRRVEGNRVYFRFDGQEVSCLARKVIPIEQAPGFFEKQIEAQPENGWFHKSLGQALSELGLQDESLVHFDKAFALNPEDLGCMNWKGHAYWQMGEMKKAEECFRKVAGNEKYEPEMRMYRGLAYFAEDDFQKAFEQFTKSGLNTTMVMRMKADCYVQTDEPEKALPLYDAWVETDALDSMAYYKRGLFYLRQAEYDAALADASLALRLDPSYTNGYMLRAAILKRRDQNELALLDYEDVMKRDPERTDAMERRYELFADMGQFKKAIEGVSQRIELDPSYDWPYFQRGVFYGELEDYPAAIEDLSKAIKMDPAYPDYHIQRAKFYAQNRQTKECMEDYDRAIELEPRNPRYYYERGRVRVRLGRYESGLNDLDKAAAGMPENLGLLYTRGNTYRELGNYDLALADLDKCRGIDSDNPYINREFAWLLVTHPDRDKRDVRRGLRWITRATSKEVVAQFEADGVTEWTEPEFHAVLAAALAANGRFAEAVTSQEKANALLDEEDKEYMKRLDLYKNEKPYVFDGGQWFQDN